MDLYDRDHPGEDEAQRLMESAAEQADARAETLPDPGLFDGDEAMQDHTLRTSMAALVNMVSRENRSNTPDFVLASFLMGALQAFENASTMRDGWYGMSPRPGMAPKLATAPNLAGVPVDDHGMRYKIWSQKHDAWWRHDGMGYTNDPEGAGIFSHAQTVRYVMQSANHGARGLVSVPVAVGVTAEPPELTEHLDLNLSHHPGQRLGVHAHADHADVDNSGGPVALTPDEAERVGLALLDAATLARRHADDGEPF